MLKYIRSLYRIFTKSIFYFTNEVQNRNSSINKSIALSKNDEYIEREREVEINSIEGKLIATLEHEVRTPLAITSMTIDEMRYRRSNDDFLINKLQIIKSQMERISFAIGMINIISKPDLFKFEDDLLQTIEVDSFLQQIVRNFKRTEQNDSIYFQFDLKKRGLLIKTNPIFLEMAVSHIFTNAIEAIKSKNQASGIIKIQVKLEKPELGIDKLQKNVVISVQDNGGGISADNLNYVMKPNFSTKKGKNRGIGLFVSNKIINLHNGRINIESEIGKGTSINIYLPAYYSNKRH